jgi:hypothetical protein
MAEKRTGKITLKCLDYKFFISRRTRTVLLFGLGVDCRLAGGSNIPTDDTVTVMYDSSDLDGFPVQNFKIKAENGSGIRLEMGIVTVMGYLSTLKIQAPA